MRETTTTLTQRHTASYWLRVLLVTTIGAVAAFGLLGGFVMTVPWSVRWKALAASFVYANCIGGICALVMPILMHRFGHRSRTSGWIVRLLALPPLIIIGCAMAGVVGIAIGQLGPSQYLDSLRDSLWISFVVGTVGSLAVVTYETMRGRLHEATLALRTKELEQADARRAAAEAQLASLESRVNPHFLFNTLNSIAALTHDDPAGAERMTSQLASLMRSSLDSGSTSLVTVEEELHVVRSYLEIEKVRFGERLRFIIDVDERVKHARIPRLSLQTIVENSVKFAVSTRREGASIIIRAKAAGTSVHVEIEDDGPGFDAEGLPEGHGLALLRSRLAMTFGDHGALRLESRPGRTVVAITIPLNHESNHKGHEAHKEAL